MSGPSEPLSVHDFLCTRCPDIWQRPDLVNHADIEMLTRLFESVKINAEQTPHRLGERTRTDFEEDPRV